MAEKREPSGENLEIREKKEDVEAQLALWQIFYDKYFGVKIDAGEIKIPERTAEEKEKFTRLIVVGGEVSLKKAYDACKSNFPCVLKLNPGTVGDYIKTEKDWEEKVNHNDRDPKKQGTYAIWVEDKQETDEINKINKGVDNRNREQKVVGKNIIKKGKFKGTYDVIEDDVGKDPTLLERFLYELKYFDETGDHLDKNKKQFKGDGSNDTVGEDSYTVCSGSGVGSPHCSPIVEWHEDTGMYIHYVCFMGRVESSRPVISNK